MNIYHEKPKAKTSWTRIIQIKTRSGGRGIPAGLRGGPYLAIAYPIEEEQSSPLAALLKECLLIMEVRQ